MRLTISGDVAESGLRRSLGKRVEFNRSHRFESCHLRQFMSADNRICIMQAEGGEWCLWMGSLSTEYHTPPHDAEWCLDRDRALAKANKLSEDSVILEGGIQVINKEEQAIALSRDIEDLSMRLRLLLTTGNQWQRGN